MNLREKLLTHTPKITPITLMGEEYFLKPLTVGDMNRQVFEYRDNLVSLAKNAGIELPEKEGKEFDEALDRFAQKYQFARAIASRLCDETGKLLFDPDNLNDLDALLELDSEVVAEFNQSLGKFNQENSASEENSK